MTRHPPRRHARAHRGSTILEVLIAILVFSFGLIGLVGLQAKAVQFSSSAEDTNRAALLANEVASEMLFTQSVTLSTTTIATWQARVADARVDGLPNGRGEIAVDATTGLATITIRWRAPRAASGAADSENRYVTQVKVVA